MHGETVKIVDAQVGEMSSQMSALDEFVTRARTQNDQSHDDHIAGLLQFQLEVAQLQSEVADTIQQRDTDLQVLHNETESSTAEVLDCTDAFEAEAKEALQTIQEQLDSNMMQDYVPTGATPQKREWTYPNELPATSNHQTIIARMRGLPDPITEPSTARTPGRSPRKQGSPRKSPSKPRSPAKAKVYTDQDRPLLENMTEPIRGLSLKEINVNVAAGESQTVNLSRSTGPGQPPLKRHATAGAVLGSEKVPARLTRNRAAAVGGVENLNQSVGVGGGRRLRNSPQQ